MFPHGYCIRWDFYLLASHVSGDAVIALSYFAIPLILIRVRARLENAIGRRVLSWFSAFIVLCGLTHVMDIAVVWLSWYWLQAAVKTATALVSMATVAQLIVLVRAVRE